LHVVGIEEHVRKKHGKKTLKKEEVKAVLELEAEKADFVSMMLEKLHLGKVMERIRNVLKRIMMKREGKVKEMRLLSL